MLIKAFIQSRIVDNMLLGVPNEVTWEKCGKVLASGMMEVRWVRRDSEEGSFEIFISYLLASSLYYAYLVKILSLFGDPYK